MSPSNNPYESPQAVDDANTSTAPPSPVRDGNADRPQWWADRSFWGMTLTQFLGAFNDNVFKQSLLLLFVAVPAYWGPPPDALDGEHPTVDLQGLGTLIFALPFVLFSGYAGFLSDRYGKQRVISLCKMAEVGIMAVGTAMFFALAQYKLSLLTFTMFSFALFAMGAHSAFFGPGKYGILPELFRKQDLPAVNGVILMTTFLAIIFGSALAGLLVEWYRDQLWIVGAVGIGIALTGVATAQLVRRTPPVDPALKFDVSMLAIPGEMLRLLKSDGELHATVWASTLFWHAAALVQMMVNPYGIVQLNVGERYTSLMVATLSVGIAAGSVVGGLISRGKFHTGVLRAGVIGMAVTLGLLGLPGGAGGGLFGYGGGTLVLCFLGAFTGFFAVPVQVYLQMKPPSALKGQMIATQNLLNWIGILAAGGFYQVLANVGKQWDLPANRLFLVPAAMMGLTALAYWPKQRDWSAEEPPTKSSAHV